MVTALFFHANIAHVGDLVLTGTGHLLTEVPVLQLKTG
jgi:hypothetical protein